MWAAKKNALRRLQKSKARMTNIPRTSLVYNMYRYVCTHILYVRSLLMDGRHGRQLASIGINSWIVMNPILEGHRIRLQSHHSSLLCRFCHYGNHKSRVVVMKLLSLIVLVYNCISSNAMSANTANNSNPAKSCVDFLTLARGLKTTPRTGWVRQEAGPKIESVADHSWRISLMAMVATFSSSENDDDESTKLDSNKCYQKIHPTICHFPRPFHIPRLA